MKTSLAVRLAPWLATAAMFIIWEAAVRILNIPQFFLPPPTLVFKAVIDYWPALYKHSLFTLSSTLVGFQSFPFAAGYSVPGIGEVLLCRTFQKQKALPDNP